MEPAWSEAENYKIYDTETHQHDFKTLMDCPGGKNALEFIHDTYDSKLRKSIPDLKRNDLKALQNNFNLKLDLYWPKPANDSYRMYYTEEKPLFTKNAHSEQVSLSPKYLLRNVTEVNTFALHSRIGADKIIYLDFDGHNISGCAWNDQKPLIVAPPFDLDGDQSNFSTEELHTINQVWQSISDDFASFDVDVTTQYDGSEDFLTRSDVDDNKYGIRVLFSPISDHLCPTCGGLSYVGTFSETG